MRFLASIYSLFVYLGKFLQPFLLLALRLYWGWAFFQAGFTKLGNIEEVAKFFGTLQIPNADLMAHLVAWVELVGGAFLFFGFLSRLAAIPLVAIMGTALWTAHHQATAQLLANQAEFLSQPPVTYLIVAAVVLCFGPGLFSFDAFFKKQLTSKE